MNKIYTKPEVVITSFEAETSVMLVSGTGSQSKFEKVAYSTVKTLQ